MTVDLADPTTLLVSSLALLFVALLLGLPAIRRVVTMHRFERLVGKLYWRIITALDKDKRH